MSDATQTTDLVAEERERCARIVRYWRGDDDPALLEILHGEGYVEQRQSYATPGARYPR